MTKLHTYTPNEVKTIKRCMKDIVYFTENFIKIRNVADQKYINTVLYPSQVRVLKSLVKHKRVLAVSSRQMGKTTLEIAYILWHVLFTTHNSTIAYITNKQDCANNFLKRFRDI